MAVPAESTCGLRSNAFWAGIRDHMSCDLNPPSYMSQDAARGGIAVYWGVGWGGGAAAADSPIRGPKGPGRPAV